MKDKFIFSVTVEESEDGRTKIDFKKSPIDIFKIIGVLDHVKSKLLNTIEEEDEKKQETN